MGKGSAKASFRVILKYFEIKKAFRYFGKQIDSMLACVCSVIDHRRRQNAVRTSVTHSATPRVPPFSFLAHFDVICDLLLNRRTATWNLFSNRSQKTSKCGKNIGDTLGYASCATFSFLPHFDVICDLLLNRRTATWNLFVKYIGGL